MTHAENFQFESQNQGAPKDVKEVEAVLTNASVAYECALKELDVALNYAQEMELVDRLEEYKKVYFAARKYLATYCPERLEKIEAQLIQDKKEVFEHYTA